MAGRFLDVFWRRNWCPGLNLTGVTNQMRAPKYGDHLRVRRLPWPYWHHGIYVNDERVIQFGRGIFDKRNAIVEATTLETFKGRGRVEVVIHGDHAGPFSAKGPGDYRTDIVHRAEWMLAHHPQRRYHLVGWNCEYVATFCVNGWMVSSQVRRVSATLGISVFTFIMMLVLMKRPYKWLSYVGWPLSVAGLYLVFVHNHVTPRVWRELEGQWIRDHPPRDSP